MTPKTKLFKKLCLSLIGEVMKENKDLNQLYEISLSKSKITQQVWYTAIYDKKANAIPAWLINEKTKEVKLSWQLR